MRGISELLSKGWLHSVFRISGARIALLFCKPPGVSCALALHLAGGDFVSQWDIWALQ